MLNVARQLSIRTKLFSTHVLGLWSLGLAAVAFLQYVDLENRPTLSEVTQASVLQERQASLKQARIYPSFGFRNLAADTFFLRFLQYFGDDEARQVSGYGLSPLYFDNVLARDPFFIDLYDYLFTSVSLYAGQPETTVALIDQALQSMSPQAPQGSYLIWRNRALDELLLLNDTEAAIKSLETAAAWAEQAPASDTLAPRIADASRQTVATLKANPDSRIARALAWSGVIARAVDDRARQLAIEKVEAFGGKVTIREDGAVEVFLPAE